jgi:tRNA pseudouridine55 synthase
MDGLLLIYKPVGITSFKVVAKLRFLLGSKKVGHAGTLDPGASGLLLVGLGKATRLQEYFANFDKRYRAVVKLGIATDTFDAEGAVTTKASFENITRETVEQALVRFRGLIRQEPPQFSALKYQGHPAYHYARQGKTVELPIRGITIYNLTLLEYHEGTGEITLDIHCSKGTYIRTLAHDLGAVLGCGAHLKSLRRSSVGPYALEQAVPLDDSQTREQMLARIISVDSLLGHIQNVTLKVDGLELIRNGNRLSQNFFVEPLSGGDFPDPVRVLTASGNLVALGRRVTEAETFAIQPIKVLL